MIRNKLSKPRIYKDKSLWCVSYLDQVCYHRSWAQATLHSFALFANKKKCEAAPFHEDGLVAYTRFREMYISEVLDKWIVEFNNEYKSI